MPMDISWYIPKKVISMRSYGDITLDDAIAANARVIELLDSSEEQFVHSIVDQSEMGEFPISMRKSAEIMTSMKHPRVGWTVVYNPNSNKIADFIGSMVAQIGRIRYRKVSTKEEALDFICERFPQLREQFEAADAQMHAEES